MNLEFYYRASFECITIKVMCQNFFSQCAITSFITFFTKYLIKYQRLKYQKIRIFFISS